MAIIDKILIKLLLRNKEKYLTIIKIKKRKYRVQITPYISAEEYRKIASEILAIK